MTVNYTTAIQAAYEDIIQKIYAIDLHECSEPWKSYEDNANIRETPGQTRLFTLELKKWPQPVTTYSDVEDTQTECNLVIGYDWGPEYDRAAQADLLAILHSLNNPSTIPEGIAFYLVKDEPIWEEIEGFKWANQTIIIEASTTTE
jgi:hypothetical protein